MMVERFSTRPCRFWISSSHYSFLSKVDYGSIHSSPRCSVSCKMPLKVCVCMYVCMRVLLSRFLWHFVEPNMACGLPCTVARSCFGPMCEVRERERFPFPICAKIASCSAKTVSIRNIYLMSDEKKKKACGRWHRTRDVPRSEWHLTRAS